MDLHAELDALLRLPDLRAARGRFGCFLTQNQPKSGHFQGTYGFGVTQFFGTPFV